MKARIFIFPLALLVFFISMLFSSCAKLPVQSVSLVEAISEEGTRMHSINTALVNNLFANKRDQVDVFIRTEYTPAFISNFMKNVPPGTDLQKELPDMINAMIPEINSRRDAMQAALEENRIKILDKLNKDYLIYELACMELKRLLESAAKVDKERTALIAQVQNLAGTKIDIEKLENQLDNFILDAGEHSQKLVKLNEEINKLLNK